MEERNEKGKQNRTEMKILKKSREKMIDIEYRKRRFNIMYIIGVSLEENQNNGTYQIGT